MGQRDETNVRRIARIKRAIAYTYFWRRPLYLGGLGYRRDKRGRQRYEAVRLR